jgi:hypothetical protein
MNPMTDVREVSGELLNREVSLLLANSRKGVNHGVQTEVSNRLLEIARRLLDASKQLLRDELSPDDVAAICFAEAEILLDIADKLRD